MLKAGASILFQGDSITDAFRRPDELNDAYRMGNGYAFLIASRLRAERPADNLCFVNRGVSGNGMSDLLERWQTDCLDLRSDVLIIVVGVIHTICRFMGNPWLMHDEFEAEYHELLVRARAELPQTRIVLGEPFLTRCGDVTQEWMDDIAARASVVRRLAGEQKAAFVPFQKALDAACQSAPPEYWAYDGIHPTAAAHWLLAQTWLETARDL